MRGGKHRTASKGRSKWLIMMLVVGMFVALLAPAALADKPTSFDKDGRAVGLVGDIGFNEWGYNYQAHLFSGDYCDAYKGAAWCQPYVGIDLVMKWNDAWLSNQDRDGDGKLDRHPGFGSYIGSGAWLTNMMKGTYEQDGKTCTWTYFVKIVAAPVDGYKLPWDATGPEPGGTPGTWYTADGVEIGPVLWGAFATVLEVYNDPCAGFHGVDYLSPNNAGFGDYGPQSYQP